MYKLHVVREHFIKVATEIEKLKITYKCLVEIDWIEFEVNDLSTATHIEEIIRKAS